MRWEALFADLEGRLAAEERRELDDEVAERTRRERALVELDARLCAATGSSLRIGLVGGSGVHGELLDVGDGWLLVRAGTGAREVLVPTRRSPLVDRSAVSPSRDGRPGASRWGPRCGRCRATGPPWGSRSSGEGRCSSARSTPSGPTTSTWPSTPRGSRAVGRTSPR